MATLYTPIRIGKVTVRNRIYMTPHTTNFALEEGGVPLPSERHAYYYRERARGGVGLIIQEATMVHPSAAAAPMRFAAAYDPRCVPKLQLIADMVHGEGAAIFLQLWHGGHHSNPGGDPGARLPALSASDIPAVEAYRIPQQMDRASIREMVKAFGRAAGYARDARYDGVELHATHSYLVEQFLSPYYNRRTDEYGGSLTNRMRFMVECLTEMREATKGELAVGARIIADEMLPGGLSSDDMAEVVRTLEDQGLVDFLDVDIGTYHTTPL